MKEFYKKKYEPIFFRILKEVLDKENPRYLALGGEIAPYKGGNYTNLINDYHDLKDPKYKYYGFTPPVSQNFKNKLTQNVQNKYSTLFLTSQQLDSSKDSSQVDNQEEERLAHIKEMQLARNNAIIESQKIAQKNQPPVSNNKVTAPLPTAQPSMQDRYLKHQQTQLQNRHMAFNALPRLYKDSMLFKWTGGYPNTGPDPVAANYKQYMTYAPQMGENPNDSNSWRTYSQTHW